MIAPYEKAGAPFTCSEVKLVSAGKYSVDGKVPQGEICVKGQNVTLGYYKNKEKTDEVFVVEEDGERWFHTGDVGQWNPDGTLSIVGRVKDIFKLDGGEYIA
jgi:long-chain acyl-CoA synthetase